MITRQLVLEAIERLQVASRQSISPEEFCAKYGVDEEVFALLVEFMPWDDFVEGLMKDIEEALDGNKPRHAPVVMGSHGAMCFMVGYVTAILAGEAESR